jgi:hypothetical protein
MALGRRIDILPRVSEWEAVGLFLDDCALQLEIRQPDLAQLR